MKRFYKETAVEAGEGGFLVLLDGKPIRTPAKVLLVLPTRALADATASEWNAVPEKADLKAGHLPLTRLATTGADRVVSQRERVIDDTAKYGESDLLCYRASDPESLVARQAEVWQPLLDWAAERYGARLVVANGTTFVAQPAEALARLRAAVAAHGDLALSALFNLTHIAGSLVIALAVSEKRLSAADAFAAAQLDELYQIERWGEDPIAAERHRGIRADIEAGARFLDLLQEARLGAGGRT
jgi:chaperone required for assembly of F1-ATPase